MKHSIRLTRSVFTATATILQFWGELSVISSRNAGPYIHGGQRDMTTYFHKYHRVTYDNYHITHKAFLACTIIGSTPSVLGHLLCLSQHHTPFPQDNCIILMGMMTWNTYHFIILASIMRSALIITEPIIFLSAWYCLCNGIPHMQGTGEC